MGTNKNAYVNKVCILQKSAIRIITFSDYNAHTNLLFKENKILKFEDQVTLENCLFAHDFLKNTLPLCFKNYFKTLNEVYSSNVRTRSSSSGCLFTPSAKSTKYGLNSIKRNAINTWNHFTKVFIDNKKDLVNNANSHCFNFQDPN